MSVLVKGMKMPISCGECFFYNGGGCFVTMSIVLLKRDEDKPEWCPLVEVSEGQEEWLDGMNVLYGEDEEPRYCDRNICFRNEYNGIECDECEVTKHNERIKKCGECEIAKYHNLEDDDSPCRDCGED